jgi:hypothetical protein
MHCLLIWNRYYSYRAEKGKTGGMLALLGLIRESRIRRKNVRPYITNFV